MTKDGVRLFSEADNFETMTGILINYCKPPNYQAVVNAHHALEVAILCMRDKYIDTVRRDHGKAEKYSEEQKCHNFTIRQIKESTKRFRKSLGNSLKKQVWHG